MHDCLKSVLHAVHSRDVNGVVAGSCHIGGHAYAIQIVRCVFLTSPSHCSQMGTALPCCMQLAAMFSNCVVNMNCRRVIWMWMSKGTMQVS